jgi:hypothetical protein
MTQSYPKKSRPFPSGKGTANAASCHMTRRIFRISAHGLLAWCHQILFARGGFNKESHDAAIRHARAAVAYGRDNATALALGGFVISLTEHDHRATAFEAF